MSKAEPVCNKKRIFIFGMLAFLILQTPAGRASAFQGAVGAGAGYDDNVLQEAEAKASGFVQYSAMLEHPLLSPDASVRSGTSIQWTLYGEGKYRDYFDVGDNYECRAGSSLYFPLRGGLAVPGMSIEGGIYRDELEPADEENNVRVSLFADWVLSARWTVGFRQSFGWTEYLEPVEEITLPEPLPPTSSGPPNPLSNGQSQAGFQPEQNSDSAAPLSPLPIIESEEREENLRSSHLTGSLFLTPRLETHFLLGYDRIESTADTESYRSIGGNVTTVFRPENTWEVYAQADFRRKKYNESPVIPEWKENILHFELGVSYFINDFEIRLQWEREVNDHPVPAEEYRQTVTQCGIIWSF